MALRNPLIPVGILLVVVGLGNWYAGRDKALEHERLLAGDVPPARTQPFDEFDKLNDGTNATLLKAFQRGADPSTLIHSKLDFYRVVQSGGQLLMLLGLFSAVAGAIHAWYQTRGRHAAVPRHS